MMHLNYLKKKRIWLLAMGIGLSFYILLLVLDVVAVDRIALKFAIGIGWLSGWVLFWARQLWVQQSVLHARSLRHQEAWHSIRSWLTNLGPLPPVTSFSITPDAALFILKALHQRRPAVVMELGAGLSTYLMADLIRQEGLSTRIISIESDLAYLQQVERELKAEALDHLVELVHAPLQAVDVNGTTYQWYILPENVPSLGMLIIDGPPESTGKLARYPALPLLTAHLTPDALVIADDADRKDVLDAIALWNQSEEWQVQFHPLSRAIATLQRHV